MCIGLYRLTVPITPDIAKDTAQYHKKTNLPITRQITTWTAQKHKRQGFKQGKINIKKWHPQQFISHISILNLQKNSVNWSSQL